MTGRYSVILANLTKQMKGHPVSPYFSQPHINPCTHHLYQAGSPVSKHANRALVFMDSNFYTPCAHPISFRIYQSHSPMEAAVPRSSHARASLGVPPLVTAITCGNLLLGCHHHLQECHFTC